MKHAPFKQINRILHAFSPFLFLAAILPVLLFAVLAMRLSFFPRASAPGQLRIWMEPTVQIIKPNQKTTVVVMAAFESENLLLPGLTVDLNLEGPGKTPTTTLTHLTAFRGRIEVGKVEITPTATGTIIISAAQPNAQLANESTLNVKTGEGRIIVQN